MKEFFRRIWVVIWAVTVGFPTIANAGSCGFYYYGLGGPIFGAYLAAAHDKTHGRFDRTEVSSGQVSTRGCSRVTLIGQSLGVNTAIEQANEDHKVTRVVLIDPPSVFGTVVVAKPHVCGVQFQQKQEVLGGSVVKGSACISKPQWLPTGHADMPLHPRVLNAIH